MIQRKFHLIHAHLDFVSHRYMHCDTTDESGDCNVKNWYCSDTFGRDHIDDRVVDNESTETSLEDEDGNRLGHHIDHIFL